MPESEPPKKAPEDLDSEGDEFAEESETDASRMPFLAHLEELRNRLVRAAIAIAVGFGVAFFFKEELFHWLELPLRAAMPPNAKLIYTAPAEAFFTYLKISLLAGIVGASPVIFYQIWRFISPGLYKHERRHVWPYVVISSGLFVGGSIFCYTMVFPYGFQFFMSFASEDLVPMISMKQYVSFSAMLLLAFGVIFQMPMVLVFLGRLGVVNSRMLAKNRKYAILIMFVAGAMFTPPDVVTQFMMALPLLVLYEFSLLMVKAAEKKKAQADEEWERDLHQAEQDDQTSD